MYSNCRLNFFKKVSVKLYYCNKTLELFSFYIFNNSANKFFHKNLCKIFLLHFIVVKCNTQAVLTKPTDKQYPNGPN